jgi:hypothetical protein
MLLQVAYISRQSTLGRALQVHGTTLTTYRASRVATAADRACPASMLRYVQPTSVTLRVDERRIMKQTRPCERGRGPPEAVT